MGAEWRKRRSTPLWGGDHVTLTARDGAGHTVETGHVLAATGYRVRLDALDFVAPRGMGRTGAQAGFPRPGVGLQSSASDAYFIRIQAAAIFSPVLRFTCGTKCAVPWLVAALAARG